MGGEGELGVSEEQRGPANWAKVPVGRYGEGRGEWGNLDLPGLLCFSLPRPRSPIFSVGCSSWRCAARGPGHRRCPTLGPMPPSARGLPLAACRLPPAGYRRRTLGPVSPLAWAHYPPASHHCKAREISRSTRVVGAGRRELVCACAFPPLLLSDARPKPLKGRGDQSLLKGWASKAS